MAVNFVSSPSVSATAVQTVQKTGGLFRAGSSLVDNREGRLLKDLVAVLVSSSTQQQEPGIAKLPSVAICSLQQKCSPDDELHQAVASLNAATQQFSSMAEQLITIAAADGTGTAGQEFNEDHINSNNIIVNEKEKTERCIYNKIDDDITLDDSITPNPQRLPQSPSILEGGMGESKVGVEDENREVSIDDNVVATVCFPANIYEATPGKAMGQNEDTTMDCIATALESPLEEKLDKLLDSVVKIKADMHQKIDRLSRRIDQIRLDVQRNMDTTDRAVCNNVLELAGIPYRKGEDLQLYFRKICSLLGYVESDIPLVDIRRKRTDRTHDKTESASVSTATSTTIKHTNTNRKRQVDTEDTQEEHTIVIIEFIFKTIRDAFYRAYLKKRTICLADLGLQSDRRIFINESLTKLNQKLKSVALKKKRDGLLHAVYTVDGAVYVQQQPGQKGHRVTSVTELE